VFRTDDFGDTWTSIGAGLPDGTVYAFAQDRKNADLLFVGSEMGVFATLDGGKTWAPFGTGLPPYPIVHDLLIHPRENDLVVATHSRGIFVADITPLQEATAAALAKDAHLFAVEPKVQCRAGRLAARSRRSAVRGAERAGGLVVNYFLKAEAKEKVAIRITNAAGDTVAVVEGAGAAGLNSVLWDFRRTGAQPPSQPAAGRRPPRRAAHAGALAPPGDYTVVLEIGDRKLSTRATVRSAPVLD